MVESTLALPDIVIDTNVIVAGLRSRLGYANQLLKLIGQGVFNMHVSVPLVLEYESVLQRQSLGLGLSNAEVASLIDYWCGIAQGHDIYYLWRPLLKDPKDDMVLELAVAVPTNSIITFNAKDFEKANTIGIFTQTPSQFLKQCQLI
jgi:putative PIN family toxin of toxin-antitoxin system